MENAKRLIDANALVKIAEKRCGVVNIKHIDDCPTVDSVEVVRCKDCERRKKSADLTHSVWCMWYDTDMPKEGFCSYGERKDNGT